MASFHGLMPVLRVSDLQRSVDFYTHLLGFETCWRSANDGGGENCMLRTGAIELLLSTGAHLGDQPHFSGTLYFNGTGIDELYLRIRDKVSIVWPLETMEYGQREFGIRDPDGYTLAFAQDVSG